MGILSKKKKKKENISEHGFYVPVIVAQPDLLDLKVAQVISALETYKLKYDPSRARQLLQGRFSGGDPRRAVNLAIVLRDAEDMILIKPSASYLLGAENVKGTTCYLDALLFSMYSRSFDLFDCLLHHPGKNPVANRLIVNLRVFVNLLRSGYLVTHDLVDMLRTSIADCGWEEARSLSQQDTSECFGFIAEMLDMPTLTFKVHLRHEGKEDMAADHKIVQERFLALSIPQPPSNPAYVYPIELVDLIDASFHTKLRVRRPVARSRSTLMGQSSQSISHTKTERNPFQRLKLNHPREISMQAEELFELIPNYSPLNSSPKQQDITKISPVVAICLKRYYFSAHGTAVINPTSIIIPEIIDFTRYTDPDATVLKSGTSIVRLRLQSAVCHRGKHVGSGHYVSVCRGSVPDQWLLFDDLAQQRVTQGSFAQLFTQEVPYLLFYELDTFTPRRRPTRRLPSIPNFGRLVSEVEVPTLPLEALNTWQQQSGNYDGGHAPPRTSYQGPAVPHHTKPGQ